jgi:hypothetical protein
MMTLGAGVIARICRGGVQAVQPGYLDVGQDDVWAVPAAGGDGFLSGGGHGDYLDAAGSFEDGPQPGPDERLVISDHHAYRAGHRGAPADDGVH